MSLTTGRGPLGKDPAGRFARSVAGGTAYVEPFLRRVRARLGGRTVIDSERVVLVHRPGCPPSYAFPAAEVPQGLPTSPEPAAPGFVQLPWDAVTTWFEEEEEVFGHPRNPYHRVDCVQCRRRLRVEVDGSVLVDTTDVTGMYETSKLPQLYVSRDLVRMDLLVPSTSATYCPYKGTARYWHARILGSVVRDVAWSYEDPHPECRPVAGLLSFNPTRVNLLQDVPTWFEVPKQTNGSAQRREPG